MNLSERRSFAQGVQFAWDATSVETAQTCLRKYYYRLLLNLTPKRSSVHLIFGGIYASALEQFYMLRSEGLSIDDALRITVRSALEASWNKAAGQPLEFDDPAKTRSNLLRSIIWYVDQFADEREAGITTYHLASGRAAVELSFALEFADGIMYCGHLDRVVEYAGGLYWMDQKTTKSTITPRFFDQFKPHNQFMGYTWAGQAILHSPVKGGIIDAAQIAVGFTRFERYPVTFTRDQLDEWRENTLETIARAQEATRRGKFPMNLASCGNYGGCPYRTLCQRSPSVRGNFIEGDYEHREPWEPIKARNE
jgi:hypothetical protein